MFKLLIDLNKAAESDVAGDEFADVRAVTDVQNSDGIKTAVFVQPPSEDIQTLLLTKSGKNWINQVFNPIRDEAQP